MSGLLEVRHAMKTYGRRAPLTRRRAPTVPALDDVSMVVRQNEVVGLVGESGSGKTTLARSVVRLVDIDSGTVLFDGEDVTRVRGRGLREYRRRVQLVYQDPYSSLNPRLRVGQAVGEPIRVHGIATSRSEVDGRVAELLHSVGLDPLTAARFPRELSGGQRQRVAIARALAAEPELLIADEAVSALDVSVQAQILNLLLDLCETRGLSMLFISHQLAVVAQIADRVAIMTDGRIVESGTAEQIFEAPAHPYTRLLLDAYPAGPSDLVTRLERVEGDAASASATPLRSASDPPRPESA